MSWVSVVKEPEFRIQLLVGGIKGLGACSPHCWGKKSHLRLSWRVMGGGGSCEQRLLVEPPCSPLSGALAASWLHRCQHTGSDVARTEAPSGLVSSGFPGTGRLLPASCPLQQMERSGRKEGSLKVLSGSHMHPLAACSACV